MKLEIRAVAEMGKSTGEFVKFNGNRFRFATDPLGIKSRILATEKPFDKPILNPGFSADQFIIHSAP